MENEFQNLLGTTQPIKRRGLWRFFWERSALFLAISCGLALIGLTVGFTYWLATQTFSCPEWAINCHVKPSVVRIKINLPLVQSIVSTIHGIGISILAYPVYIFAEAAIWPILTYYSYTLASLDTYLSATRGSVPGLLQALRHIGSGKSSTVIICVGLVTILLQADRLIIGQVYTLGNVTTTYESRYEGGGGIGLSFNQMYPPGPVPAPVTAASSFFTSWSKNLSSEPWPEMRDFIVDRTALAQVGSFSISGLRASKTITCSGQTINIVDDTNGKVFEVASNFPAKNSSILLRMQPRLAVWVDQVEYKSSVRTVTTLVFASMNGTIENGISTPATTKMKSSSHPISQISGVKCAVDVTLEQATISIGIGPDNKGINVSAIQTVIGPGNHNSPHGPLGDVAQWMGAVITSLGTSIYGAQPLFEHKASLPVVFTTTQDHQTPEEWTQDELITFISVASGALALSMSKQWNKAKITLKSDMGVRQLVASKSWILLVPALVILLIEAFLAAWLCFLYRNSRIQEMRQAGTSDIIWSTQNQSMRQGVEELRSSPKNSEQLNQMKVRYGLLAEEHTHMGLLWDKIDQKLGSDILLSAYPKTSMIGT